ncbi:MAG TPA: exodeoxyribonuclease VII small subunit [Candidatus Eisenbacteria bacterium]|nr:exodeoxyribonuclease VII small subunit [Candidatus Eisenbacteria bacterium]
MTRKAAADPNATGEAPSFETMMDRLQDLVGRLEQGNLTLEDSIRSFEEGMDLVRRCTEVLNQAEERIRKLTRDARGTAQETPLQGVEDEAGTGGDELPF